MGKVHETNRGRSPLRKLCLRAKFPTSNLDKQRVGGKNARKQNSTLGPAKTLWLERTEED